MRTFDNKTRNLLDLAAIPILKQESNLPVIVDPSHATGRRDLILPMSLAAIATGADGLIIEADIDPEKALSDQQQTVSVKDLGEMLPDMEKVAQAVGKTLDLTCSKTLFAGV